MNVRLRVSEDALTHIVEHWKNDIYAYLIATNRCMNISEVGGWVGRPYQLPSSVKLVEVLREDQTSRFILMGDGNEIKVRGFIRLDDEAFQPVFEEWRKAIADYIRMTGRGVELSELGFKVKRPANMKSVGLQEMLKCDPYKRFELRYCMPIVVFYTVLNRILLM